MDVAAFHAKGYKGKGIKIAILDSGLGEDFMSQLESDDNEDGVDPMNII